jgi:hypothetical protein
MIRYFFVCLLFISFQISAQNTFVAVTDAKEVLLDSYFTVSFKLDGQGKNFRAPKFENFTRLQGPSQSMSTRIINGAVSAELSYSYVLQPKKVGTYSIGSASIMVGKETLKSAPIKIKVVKGSKKSAEALAEEKQYFIKVELDTNQAYVGQQVLLTYKLYTTKNIDNYNILNESNYEGFYAEELPRLNYNMNREILDGIEYSTKTIRKIALFPQQTGTYNIDPLTVRLRISVEDPNRRSFFFSTRSVQKMVQTDGAKIKVKPMPEDKSGLWNGAVGKFGLSYGLNKKVITTDEAINLQLKIVGDGDFRRINPPKIVGANKFDIYDPNVIAEDKDNMSGDLTYTKTYEYVLVPKEKGNDIIYPQLTYFDTDSSRYITLSDTINVTIRQGSNAPVSQLNTKKEVVEKTIRPILRESKLGNPSHGFFASIPFWILSCLPIFLIGGIFYKKKEQTKEDSVSISDRKQRAAHKVALGHLEKAKAELEKGENKPFYNAIDLAVMGFVSDKFKIPMSAMTKQKVMEVLESKNASSELQTKFTDIMQECEQALYGFSNDTNMQRMYKEAVDWISEVQLTIDNG